MSRHIKQQLGFTIIELLVIIQIMIIIIATVSTVFSNVLHTRTRAQFNNLTRTNGNIVIENIVRDIKYSFGFDPSTSTPIFDTCNENPCASGYNPICSFSKLGVKATSSTIMSYELLPTEQLVKSTEYFLATGEIREKIISPSSLKAKSLQFTINPPLCVDTSGNNYITPNLQDNSNVRIVLTLQSPYYERTKAQGYTQAEIVLEASATLRTYQRLQ